MTLLGQIKDDLLKARKAQDRIDVQVLTTLYSEAAMKGKNAGNRESTDEEVISTVKKFIKNAKEMLEHIEDLDDRIKYEDEIDTYENYLPTQLKKGELKRIILQMKEDGDNIGSLMKKLKAKFDGQYDGKEASQIIKECL